MIGVEALMLYVDFQRVIGKHGIGNMNRKPN